MFREGFQQPVNTTHDYTELILLMMSSKPARNM